MIVGDSITGLLAQMGSGDAEAFDRLIPLVYRELHRIADAYLRRERPGHTLQPTALIHEAYLRLVGYEGTDFQNRTHFFAVAARVMRQILVDHARARQAEKRGPAGKVVLRETLDFAPERERIVVALDDALQALAKDEPRKARLVEMRFFGGMTHEDIALHEQMPVHTVKRELKIAQSWLRRGIEH